MLASSIPQLSSLLWEYYSPEELITLAGIFHVALPQDSELKDKQDFLAFASKLFSEIENGNTRAFVDSLVEQIEIRTTTAVAKTNFERRAAHEVNSRLLERLKEGLTRAGVPSEIAIPAARPFEAKAEIREFLEQANTPVLVVDPYVGVATLDCLRLVSTPVRLLTSTSPQAMESGFENALRDFKAERRSIEVRRGSALHDRHLSFNDRCWLVGSSLKDAGKKAFNCTEIIDSREIVVDDLETRWNEAVPFP